MPEPVFRHAFANFQVMFWKKKLDLKAMSQILPTSKFDLKMQCLAIARGDVEGAEKLYNFLAGDMNLPDVTPPRPTTIQQIRDSAGGLFSWFKENQGDLIQAYNFIQSMRGGTPIAQAAQGAADVATELPPIPPSQPIE